MAPLASAPSIVQKEIVQFLHFPQEDVLQIRSEKALRQQKLEKATSVGNLNHTKVGIVFEDIHGLKKIETTIWATTKNNIILKKGSTIPIHRIRNIVFV